MNLWRNLRVRYNFLTVIHTHLRKYSTKNTTVNLAHSASGLASREMLIHLEKG